MMKKPPFIEDNGIACVNNSNLMSRKGGVLMVRRNSLRNIGSFYEEESHFLQACFLCRKNLGLTNDIFMYRGDTPFCSEECRQEQIDIDESAENKRSLKVLRKIKNSSKLSSNSSSSSLSSSPAKTYTVRTGVVSAS